HDTQDELYFVHRGTATFTFDGAEHTVGEGGLVHVESTTHRQISNRTGDDLVLLIVGGKDGYVERDGHLVDPEIDLPRRQGLCAVGSTEAHKERRCRLCRRRSGNSDGRPDDGLPA